MEVCGYERDAMLVIKASIAQLLSEQTGAPSARTSLCQIFDTLPSLAQMQVQHEACPQCSAQVCRNRAHLEGLVARMEAVNGMEDGAMQLQQANLHAHPWGAAARSLHA
ncbi:hypothetical protein Mmc1_3013 [Magnetococcus marinus MC-1]|uniref:Uncharacterized protein n=1 Tax=Magnetococcus marinus (strain ATCC BAA-1437 / JCM 17883 / MC-1) TaxID=156889 RepID=A0LC11_MAGMM|nr:hypothetical protein [Magnetococcus marinus]ABK45504.1 hypothetical protein Mmc1_3013 [Magnetococcus marinus MC-1]